MKYYVQFTSVDGSGFFKVQKFDGNGRQWQSSPWDPNREWDDKESAIKFANEQQRISDKDGNPWGYQYRVCTDAYITVYRTQQKEKKR